MVDNSTIRRKLEIRRLAPLGRVYVPPDLPAGTALFYTTTDFAGRLNVQTVDLIQRFISECFGIEAKLYTCHQVHGTAVSRVSVRQSRVADFAECDALWSSERGVALGIKVADCLPVTLIEAKHNVIANIHSGWRGAAQQIVKKTLKHLKQHSNFDAAASHAYLGPTLRSCCFEVGEEVIEQFKAAGHDVEKYVDRSRGVRPYLDVVGFTIEMLAAFGFPRESVHDSGLCTRCEGSDFHSYRRDRASGRNLAIVAQ